jgi:hypothetical protein
MHLVLKLVYTVEHTQLNSRSNILSSLQLTSGDTHIIRRVQEFPNLNRML